MGVTALTLPVSGLTCAACARRAEKALREMNVISRDVEEELTEAYLVFVKFRIMNQIRFGGGDLSYINPDMLGSEDAARLRKAMRSVESFQKYINELLLFGQSL